VEEREQKILISINGNWVDHIQLNDMEMKGGRHLKINVSVPNLRLFVGNIPKSKGKSEIMEEFSKVTGNI